MIGWGAIGFLTQFIPQGTPGPVNGLDLKPVEFDGFKISTGFTGLTGWE